MRIIAGEFRSRTILAPKTSATRPITDRVKQSLFDVLSPHIEGARAYDCFAGTGSMGLECLSRGASHATFFEADRSAVSLLRKNIAALQVQGRCTVIEQDLFKWFENSAAPARRAGIVFLDPPYRFVVEKVQPLQRLVSQIAESDLAPDGLLVFRHDAKNRIQFRDVELLDRRIYGSMAIELLRPDRDAGGIDTL